MSNAQSTDQSRPDIQKRTCQFALRVLKVVASLRNDVCGQVVGRQLARAGTSVGANVEEAQGAQSKAEFARKLNIARAEALETRYWLRLTADTGLLPRPRLAALLKESDEIIRVLVTIVKQVRRPSPKE